MRTGQWSVVLRHVQRVFQGGSLSGLSEGQLLDRFASDRDELAFGALLARHGPMVLGVCRGVLDDPNDVDDAFQATFLVLVKKAGVLRDGDRLAQWLYGVARKVALRARSDASRRKAREKSSSEEAVDPRATLDADLRELQVLIREEVDRLPSNDRMAVVLCYLEGLTHEEAADRLGWPVGTVKGRLSRARDKLRDRLSRRGVALPAAAIASGFAEVAKASVPAALLRSTTLAAIQLASGKSLTAGIVSAQALTLMEGVIGTMFMTKLKIAAMALVATCAVGVPGVLAYQGTGAKGTAPTSDQAPPPANYVGQPKLAVPAVVAEAKPTSPDARIQLAERAMALIDQTPLNVIGFGVSLEARDLWSKRLAEAQIAAAGSQPERIKALQAHLDRANKTLSLTEDHVRTGQGKAIDALEAQFRRDEAARWLAEIEAGQSTKAGPDDAGKSGRRDAGDPNLDQTPGDEKQNEAIRVKLEEKLSMNFASPTPLEDIIKYIKDSTQDEAAGFPAGLPMYVAPEGLKIDRGFGESVTMASTITIYLEGIPLRTTLRLALKQLHLGYRVEGGLILITSEEELSRGRAAGPGFPGGMSGVGGGFR